MDDLNALLTSAKSLNTHLGRPDQPKVVRSLEQIESDSRNLVSRLPASQKDGRSTYLLARGNVDVTALGKDLAEMDTTATFQPLQPLADNDVQGYLRHVHEQTLISTIEESRRETQAEFYRIMEERTHRDWEEQKKQIFQELGGRMLSLADSTSKADLRKSVSSIVPGSRPPTFAIGPSSQAKMRAFGVVIGELNAARLRGTSYPIINSLARVYNDIQSEEHNQVGDIFQVLAKIVEEPTFLPSAEHSTAHVLNASTFEGKYTRAHLASSASREAANLRCHIIRGSKQALEEQYQAVIDRALRSNQAEAQLGGDPTSANRMRGFISLRYYRSGRWDDRIELVRGQPEWARLFYLVRTGYGKEALEYAISIESALNQKESYFTTYFKTWVESGFKRLQPKFRDRLQTSYSSHLLHSATCDPFKMALFKLMGRLDISKRTMPYVTSTTEDWLWFQLAMLDDDDDSGLASLNEVILGYGEYHFEGPPGQNASRKGMWSWVLLLCGMFEMAVSALLSQPSLHVEAVHVAIALAYYGLLKKPLREELSELEIFTASPGSRPAINLGLLISRFVRHFMRSDPQDAMNYVYTVCLSEPSDEDAAAKDRIDLAWELTRRIIVSIDNRHSCERLTGGFKADGTQFTGTIEQNLPLLKLRSQQQYKDLILLRAAAQSEREQKLNDAIKLYNLAGAHTTVVACLARGLGEYIAEPGDGGEEARDLERTAREIIRHYDKTNRVAGKERDTVIQLLGVREAMDAKQKGRLQAALEAIEATEIIPLDADGAAITLRAADYRDQDDVISRNLYIILPFTMELLDGLQQKIKAATHGESNRNLALKVVRKKARALMMFAGSLRYRLSPDIHSYLTRLDVAIAL